MPTWAGRSAFQYEGSVRGGTRIVYGRGHSLKVEGSAYARLLEHFKGRTVYVGTSRTDPPSGSVGEWITENLRRPGTACYIGAILVAEGYAEKAGGPEIRFKS